MKTGKRITLYTDRRGWTIAILWDFWLIPGATFESRRSCDAVDQAEYWRKRYDAPIKDIRRDPVADARHNGDTRPVQ